MKRFHNQKCCPGVITHLFEDNSSGHAEGMWGRGLARTPKLRVITCQHTFTWHRYSISILQRLALMQPGQSDPNLRSCHWTPNTSVCVPEQQPHQPSVLPCSPVVGMIIPPCFYSPYPNSLQVSAYQTALANQPRHSEQLNFAGDYHGNMPPFLHWNVPSLVHLLLDSDCKNKEAD